MSKVKLNPVVKIQKTNNKGARALLQNVRIAFVYLSKPAVFNENAEQAKYQVTALIPKKQGDKLQKMIFAAADEVIDKSTLSPKDKEIARKNAKATGNDGALFGDGDNKTDSEGKVYDGFEDCYTMRFKTGASQNEDGTFSPKVAFAIKDSRNNDIPREEIDSQFYSGVWADISFVMAAYKGVGNGKAGVTTYLNGVMKLYDDERLGASSPFESRNDVSTFGDSEDDDDSSEADEAPASAKKKGKKKGL